MDPEEFGNLTDEGPGHEVHYDQPSDFVLIPTAIVTLASVVADVFIIYVIAKFQDLHTISHWYLLNWRIASVWFLVLSPFNFMTLADVFFVEKTIACIWFVEIWVAFTGNLLFIFAITVDWCMLYFSSQTICIKIRSYYKLEIVLVWLVILALSVYICFECMLNRFHFLVVTETLYTAFVIVIHILRYLKSKSSSDAHERSNLVLVLITSHFLCWFPHSLRHLFEMFNDHMAIYPEVTVLFIMIGCSHSIFVILILYYYDKGFYAGIKSLCNYNRESNNSENSYESIYLNS